MRDTAIHHKHFKKVEEIFDSVLECKIDKRKGYLKELCGDDTDLRSEVESLLHAADQADGFLSIAPEAVEHVFADRLDPESLLDQHFGPYRLIRVLERGGMGVVFLAERADGHYRQKVAIKFANYKIGAGSLMGRFHRERQILANIRHPNVARLLDGGTSADGYPYLVMEYISGQPMDLYCQLHKLTPRKILELFLVVCETVQHAQQRLIVHCDLKPNNIMVTAEGSPKLLDFGIAQLLDPLRNQAEEVGGLDLLKPMTPEYAAPEQLSGDPVTTATDVHALGNILYRLLTGSIPHRATLGLVAPSFAAPGYLRKQLQGDIDNIVTRALSLDPDARYSSAQQLAEDIRCFLGGDIVSASDSGAAYRTGKFLQRHRLGAALASLSVLSILIGISATTMQWQSANTEREAAERRLREVRELANTIVFDLPQSIGALPGSTPLRERLINQGIAYLDRISTVQTDAGLMKELAGAYHELATLQGNPMKANLGDPESAIRNYQKSITMRESLLSSDSGDHQITTSLATSYSQMSAIYGVTLKDTAQARALTNRCLELLAPLTNTGLASVTRRLLSCQTIGAHWANVDADYSAATAYLNQAERLLAALPGEGEPMAPRQILRLRGRVHEEWAQIYAGTGDHAAAIMHERKRLSQWSKISDSDLPRSRLMGAANHGLAARLAAGGMDVEALEAYRQSLRFWNDWRDRYPADVSANQAIAIVNAEMAHLLWREVRAPKSAHVLAQELSCQHYSDSIAILNESTSGNSTIPSRYSWSPTAVQIREQFNTRCSCTD